MKHVFLLVCFVVVNACATVPVSSPRVAGIQVVCYGENGQPLFPVQVVDAVDFKSVRDGWIETTYSNGMHLWIHATSCVAAELNADDLAALKAKSKPPAPAPAPAPTPEK